MVRTSTPAEARSFVGRPDSNLELIAFKMEMLAAGKVHGSGGEGCGGSGDGGVEGIGGGDGVGGVVGGNGDDGSGGGCREGGCSRGLTGGRSEYCGDEFNGEASGGWAATKCEA